MCCFCNRDPSFSFVFYNFSFASYRTRPTTAITRSIHCFMALNAPILHTVLSFCPILSLFPTLSISLSHSLLFRRTVKYDPPVSTYSASYEKRYI